MVSDNLWLNKEGVGDLVVYSQLTTQRANIILHIFVSFTYCEAANLNIIKHYVQTPQNS